MMLMLMPLTQRSEAGEFPYSEYYVWADSPEGLDLPSNWLSKVSWPVDIVTLILSNTHLTINIVRIIYVVRMT